MLLPLKIWENRKTHLHWGSETNFNGAATVANGGSKLLTNVWAAGYWSWLFSFTSVRWWRQRLWWEALQESTNNRFLSMLHHLLTLQLHSSFAIKPNGIWVSWWFSRLKVQTIQLWYCTKSSSRVARLSVSFLWPPYLLALSIRTVQWSRNVTNVILEKTNIV